MERRSKTPVTSTFLPFRSLAIRPPRLESYTIRHSLGEPPQPRQAPEASRPALAGVDQANAAPLQYEGACPGRSLFGGQLTALLTVLPGRATLFILGGVKGTEESFPNWSERSKESRRAVLGSLIAGRYESAREQDFGDLAHLAEE